MCKQWASDVSIIKRLNVAVQNRTKHLLVDFFYETMIFFLLVMGGFMLSCLWVWEYPFYKSNK